jgi:hypothetical protein
VSATPPLNNKAFIVCSPRIFHPISNF